MSRWFGRKGRHEMSSYEKNILSDPTSDGNVHGDNFSADPTASPPPYRYEEFDRRLGTDRENDSETSDFTQTCPTCGGTGKLTREQENDLVALIPVRDSRLKPRRTMLYLLLAIFLGVVISVVAGVFLFPRSISIKLEKAVPLNVSMSLSNTTKPFIVINNTITINNSNFFEAKLDGFSFEVNWENYVVAQQDFKQTVKVPARSSLNHSFSVKTVYGFANQEAKKIRLEMQKRSFSRLGVRQWNEIPCHMRDLPKKMFKRVLRTSLLNIFQNEDDYIHIPEIIKKVGEID
ncbi:transmembrane protein 106C-like isoform X1 [Acropora palmata]|uniref:transmembrane protein 106C-like isoform X1 n=1 Tax=Acropora palmata TaxID=6131 RepID=UPI003DA05774